MIAAPLVSVVICAFNAEATIAETLASARRQTLTDIEVLIIDDGSTDSTARIVADIATGDHRIRLISQPNAGVSQARNRGIDDARGQFIAFLDADDLWTTEHLATQVDLLRADTTLAVAFANASFIDSRGRHTGEQSRTISGEVSARDAFAGNPCTTCSTMVIRRTAFAEIGAFASGLDHAEDQEWILRALLRGCRMICSGAYSVSYRASPAGQSSDLARMFRGFQAVRATAFATAPAFAKRYASEAEGRICLYLARRAVRLDQGAAAAMPYLLRALRRAPSLIVAAPLQLATTLLAVAAPGLGRRAARLRSYRATPVWRQES